MDEENRGAERLGNWLKVTQPTAGREFKDKQSGYGAHVLTPRSQSSMLFQKLKYLWVTHISLVNLGCFYTFLLMTLGNVFAAINVALTLNVIEAESLFFFPSSY